VKQPPGEKKHFGDITQLVLEVKPSCVRGWMDFCNRQKNRVTSGERISQRIDRGELTTNKRIVVGGESRG